MAQYELEIEHYTAERMWDYVLNKPLRKRTSREFRAEPMNCPVVYKKESICEDVENTIGVSGTNGAQKCRYNDRYISYIEDTRSTIKPPIASPQECVEGNKNS